MKASVLRVIAAVSVVVIVCLGWWINSEDPGARNEAPQLERKSPSSTQLDDGMAVSPLAPTEAGQVEIRMLADSPASSHPVERAVALGTVLDSQIAPVSQPGQWTRVRIVQTSVQPRPVRVVEQWVADRGDQQLRCTRRDMFLADQLIVKTARGLSESVIA